MSLQASIDSNRKRHSSTKPGNLHSQTAGPDPHKGTKRRFRDDEPSLQPSNARRRSRSRSESPHDPFTRQSQELSKRQHRARSGNGELKSTAPQNGKVDAEKRATSGRSQIAHNQNASQAEQAELDGTSSNVAEQMSAEERRKRRDAIRAKYNSEQNDIPASILPQAPDEPETRSLQHSIDVSADDEPEVALADDMFASDDDDDMFGNKSAVKSTSKWFPEQGQEMEKGLADNWDDPKGYYRFHKSEVLDGRYQLLDSHGLGKGMFSNVVRASDADTSTLVAIKIIRNNESMRKAAVKEMDILQKLASEDPSDKKHLVRLRRSFTHKGHLCMVFENLSQDLRDLLKKFGRDTGFDMSAVRAYAHQLFLGLDLLKQCNTIHADLKPDNILASEAPYDVVKICDLGSAFDATEAADTPELASRFYRAPEVMLGIPYDFAIDMWSIGCTLFELYTGQILFTGGTNNQMLHSIMECRGMLTERFAERGSHSHEHFEFRPFLSFRSIETDPATGFERARLIQSFKKPERDLKHLLFAASPHLKRSSDRKPTYGEKLQADRQTKELTLFADLLDKCLKTNPDQRIRPQDALQHAFFGNPKTETQQFQPAFRRPVSSKKG